MLTIGYGLTNGQDSIAGARQVVRNIALEPLVSFYGDGRPQPWLAERLTESADHLTWTVHLRPNVKFHDGTGLTAAAVRDVLSKQLPDYLGSAFDDVKEIRAVDASSVSVSMKRHSNFVLEALDVLVEKNGPVAIGTGAFAALPPDANSGVIEMAAFQDYYGGRALLDRIVIKPYASIRSAWADLLRSRVDMLYEVGVDALDLMQPSTDTRVFTSPRPYASVIVLNTSSARLRDKAVRRALNLSIDRKQFVRDGLRGHGRPATGVVWPDHWSNDVSIQRLPYVPGPAAAAPPLRLTLMLSDPSHERLALIVQQQLQKVGVDLAVEFVPLDQALARVQAGHFDAWLADLVQGPTLLRSYLFWHSRGPFNWAHYRSGAVDASLDAVRHAANDDEYRAGVAAFQVAMTDDPPAIFLCWSERSRAVSSRFAVPIEPGRDILSSLRRWRPVGGPRDTGEN